MGSKKKYDGMYQLKEKTIYFGVISGLTILFSLVANLIFTKIFSNIFSPSDFGFLKTVLSALFFLVGINNLNFAGAIIRFGNPKYINKLENPSSHKKNLLMTTLVILTIVAILISASISFFTLMGYKIFSTERNEILIFLLITLLFPRLFLYTFSSFGIALQNLDFLIFQGLVVGFETGVSIIFVILFNTGVEGVLIAYFIVDVCFALCGIVFQFKKIGIGKFSKKEFLKILTFTFPTFFVVITQRLYEFLAVYILYVFISSEEIAFYSLGLSAVLVINIMEELRRTSLASTGLQIYDGNGEKPFSVYLAKISRIYLAFLIGIAIGTIQLASFLIELLSNTKYIPGAILVPFFAIGLVAEAAQSFAASPAIAKEKMRSLSTIQTIAQIFGIILLFILVPPFGALGAGITFMILSISKFVMVYLLSKKLLKIPYNIKKFLGMIFISLVSMLLFVLLVEYIPLLIASFISISFYFLIIFLLGIVNMKEIEILLEPLLHRIHQIIKRAL